MIVFTHYLPLAIYSLGILVALYGFGLVASQLATDTQRSWGINLTIGLGLVIFLGGIFNLLHIAYGWVFDILILVGIALCVLKRKDVRLKWPANKSQWFFGGIVALFILGIMLFTIATQLPPKAYNYHDDLEKYFAHPVRMLQTGTLLGSPLSAIGSETIGGQAVLHGIILNHFPIHYLNGVDAVGGLFLCLILSICPAGRDMRSLPLALISLLLVFGINPQYVNISASYTAIALMMTAFILSCRNASDNSDDLPPPLLMGLIYAGLVALKSNFALFPAIHFSAYIITHKLYGTKIDRLVRWGLTTIVYSLLFVLPWVLLHLPHYLRSASQSSHEALVTGGQFPNLFSWKPLYYGGSYAHYTLIGLALVFLVGMFLYLQRKATPYPQNGHQAGVISIGATVVASYLFIIAAGPLLNGYPVSLRYAVPYIIAAAPLVFAMACRLALTTNSGGHKVAYKILLSVGIIILVNFALPLGDRIRQAYNYGSILAFSQFASSSSYLAYNHHVLHGDAQARINAIQEKIPPGDRIVAWITTPFHLDYARNTIYDAEPAGIASPWAYIPEAEYIIYEYRGFAVRPHAYYIQGQKTDPGKRRRKIAKHCLAFIAFLHGVRKNADEIYNDGGIVVYKVRSGPNASSNN